MDWLLEKSFSTWYFSRYWGTCYFVKWLSGYGRFYVFYKYLGKVVDILFIKSYSYIVLKSSLFSLLLQDLQLGNPAGFKFFYKFYY